MTMKRLCRFLLACALLLTAACATVQPWDRDLTAEKKMSFNPSPQLQAVDDHIYYSKEASAGGATMAGGGCGCN